MLCIALVGIVTGGANYDNNLIYSLAFLGAGLFLATLLQTYLQLFGVELEWLPPAPVFAGETAEFPLLVRVSGGTTRRALELTLLPGRRAALGDRFAVARAMLLELALLSKRRAAARSPPPSWGDARPGLTRLSLAVPATRRGLLDPRPGRVRLATRYPLGLFRAWLYLPPPPTCLVYPRAVGRALDPPLRRDAEQPGARVGNRPGSEDFIGMSAYRPGDPVRHISWRAAARGAELLVNRFGSAGRDEQLLLCWSDLAHDHEERLAQLCRWVLDAERLQLQYGLRLPGFRADPGRAGEHRAACLRALALFPAGSPRA